MTGMPTVTDLSRTVEFDTATQIPPMEIVQTVKAMLDHGSRYQNMEKELGVGICLVLGCQLPESYWKKLMKKSGHLFKSVTTQIRQTEALKLASDYAPLQEKIVSQTLADLMRRRSSA
ncbi:hypothetical protein Q7P37_009802 [Cladosporium fusiforme]